MEKLLSYEVSNRDIERKFKNDLNKIEIIIYSELNNITSIFQILPSTLCACFILLKITNNSAHWCVIIRHNNIITYFDSYGVSVDGELRNISKNDLYVLHENGKLLLNLIKKIPNTFKFSYNLFQYQDYNDNIQTCGKWCIIYTKFIFNGLLLPEIQYNLKKLKKTYNCSYDELVCKLYQAL